VPSGQALHRGGHPYLQGLRRRYRERRQQHRQRHSGCTAGNGAYWHNSRWRSCTRNLYSAEIVAGNQRSPTGILRASARAISTPLTPGTAGPLPWTSRITVWLGNGGCRRRPALVLVHLAPAWPVRHRALYQGSQRRRTSWTQGIVQISSSDVFTTSATWGSSAAGRQLPTTPWRKFELRSQQRCAWYNLGYSSRCSRHAEPEPAGRQRQSCDRHNYGNINYNRAWTPREPLCPGRPKAR